MAEGSEMEDGRSRGEGVFIIMHDRSHMTIHGPSHPYNAGTEHVGFYPTRQTSLAPLAPSAKCRAVFGESHEECAASHGTACEADFLAYG